MAHVVLQASMVHLWGQTIGFGTNSLKYWLFLTFFRHFYGGLGHISLLPWLTVRLKRYNKQLNVYITRCISKSTVTWKQGGKHCYACINMDRMGTF